MIDCYVFVGIIELHGPPFKGGEYLALYVKPRN